MTEIYTPGRWRSNADYGFPLSPHEPTASNQDHVEKLDFDLI